MHSYDDARRRDEQHVVLVRDELHARKAPRLFVEDARLDALAAARLDAVVLGERTLAVAVLGDGQYLRALPKHDHIHRLVPFRKGDGANARRISAHRAHVRLLKADALSGAARDKDVVLARRELHGDELVVLVDADGDLAAAQDMVEFARLGLLDDAALGRHHKVSRAIFQDGQHGGDLLARSKGQDVDDGAAACRLVGFGDLVPLDRVHLPEITEEEDGNVRGADEHLLDEVVLFGAVPRDAHAAAVLGAVFGDGEALDIAAARHGDDDVLLVDEVFVLDRAVVDGDLRAAGGGILLPDLHEVGADDGENARLVGEDIAKVRDGRVQRVELFSELFHFEGSEALQSHLEDGVRLLFAEREGLEELRGRIVLIARALDDGDDFVDVGKRQNEAFDDMRALFRPREIEAGAAGDDFLLVFEVVN